MQYFFLLFFYVVQLHSCAGCSSGDKEKPNVETFTYSLGDKKINLYQRTYKEPSLKYIFLQLHDNEETGEQAALQYLKKNSGVYIEIENNKQRMIDFSFRNIKDTVDPNRIYTKTGIEASLRKPTKESIEEVEKLGTLILEKLENVSTVIAMHNNTNDNYSIKSYLPGGDYAKDAKDVYYNEKRDFDDFFFTTDAALFEKLKSKKFNVILQDNENATDDGSLSVYYGKRGTSYINIEAEHGHLKEQKEMLKALMKIIKN